jgi:hypothetical protein
VTSLVGELSIEEYCDKFNDLFGKLVTLYQVVGREYRPYESHPKQHFEDFNSRHHVLAVFLLSGVGCVLATG